jgi:hypothetical protein
VTFEATPRKIKSLVMAASHSRVAWYALLWYIINSHMVPKKKGNALIPLHESAIKKKGAASWNG